MPFETSGLQTIVGPGGPVAGVNTAKTQLLDDKTRAALGLPPASTVNAPKPKETLDGTPNGLGKDDFMKLLLVQMTNQDPLKPLEDKEFISQLAQFNTLEQMQNANKVLTDMLTSQSIAQASAMLGKQIEAGTVTGEVSSVVVVDGKPLLTVGDKRVALADVTKVLPGTTSADEPDTTTDSTDSTDATTSTTPTTAP